MLRHLRVHNTILLLCMFENVLNKSTKFLPQKGVCQPSWAPGARSGTCDLVFSLALSSLSPIYCTLVMILVPVSGGGAILSRNLKSDSGACRPCWKQAAQVVSGGPPPPNVFQTVICATSKSTAKASGFWVKARSPETRQCLVII